MFVPLDLLHDYLENIVNHDFVIYRFWPHGSKNIENLVSKRKYTMFEAITRPILIYHDQEPLDFDQYQAVNLDTAPWFKDWPLDFRQFWLARNLRSACEVNIYDRAIITHSEYQSQEVAKYQANGFEPVYVWSHALLARDWYRYAMLDPKLNNEKTLAYDFNIYARAWTGSREYRLLFLALLYDIAHHCRVTFSVEDQGHYLAHKFINPNFDIHGTDIENLFGNAMVPSDSSATYDADHYQTCLIDVVLETIFDEQRIHLTEKTLRPLACGQPFILAAPAESLKYLQSYGFETFAPFINEGYDKETNPVKRLRCIVQEMQRIARLPTREKVNLAKSLQSIAYRNKKHFFSNDFFTQVINEYMVNMQQALHNTLKSKMGTEWHQHLALYDKWPAYKAHPDAGALFEVRAGIEKFFNLAFDQS